MIDEAARCGYSKCRAHLPPPGPQGGRPRAFCRDTRWPGGRTCAQMARAERDALDALGLDSGRTGFQLDADRLREHVEAVRGPVAELAGALAAVSTRLDEVEGEALAAVETANRRAAEAEATRVEAQQARERAERTARTAEERAEQAGEERDGAVQRAAAAARQALEATEALGAARQQAEEALTARRAAEERTGVAERRAADALHAAQEAVVQAQRADAERVGAQERAQEWRDEVAQLRSELTGVRAELAAATVSRDDATGRADAATEALAAEREARGRVEHELVGARQRADAEAALRVRADAELQRLHAELDRAHADTARARAELAAQQEQGTDELRRLVAALAAGRPAEESDQSAG